MALLYRTFTALKDAIFPSRCFGCRTFVHGQLPADKIEHPKKRRDDYLNFDDEMVSFLCRDCINNFFSIVSPICSTCGKLFKTREGDNHECEDCIRSPKHFNSARASGVYAKSLMDLIHQLKYKGKIQLAKPLGRLLFTTLFQFWGNEAIDIIIPVPLHKKRFKKRGFNQAYLLIKDWGKTDKISNRRMKPVTIEKDILFREKHTKPQTGLSRKDRVKNIKNAFLAANAEKINGKRVLIVDDVYTTGATTNECARVLIKHGAKSVDVLTLARAV